MSVRKSLIVAAALAVFGLGGVVSADAGPWQNHHPLRVEVNHRLANQDHRINRALRQGRIGWREAANLHREDRMIRHEERLDARRDGGHITRGEDRALNHQENAVSRQIYNHAH
jgi:hypothetical protein